MYQSYSYHNYIPNHILILIAICDIVWNVKKSCFNLLRTSFTIQWEDTLYTVILTNGYHYCVKYLIQAILKLPSVSNHYSWKFSQWAITWLKH